MERQTIVAIIVIGLLCLVLFIPGVSMITSNVFGANVTNSTTVTKVWVWNAEPNVTEVIVTPSSVELTAGNITTVNCTAIVWDYNGWQDVNVTRGVLYDATTSMDSDPDDNNEHYTNTSCYCEQNSSTSAACTCLFSVWYYANYGTWICNMSVADKGGNATERIYNFNSSGNTTFEINPVLGIDTSDEIDFGNLSVTETSDLIPANVSNWGNVPINVTVRGYGGTDDANPAMDWAMVCDFGNISWGYERYSTNDSAEFDTMTLLNNVSTYIPNFDLPSRTNDTHYMNDTNTTYWRLQVPLTVGGYCNGTVIFSAAETTIS
jgi:hypothetical protein